MNYLKAFEKFEENIEDDYNHFNGIDISDISFTFIWSSFFNLSAYHNDDVSPMIDNLIIQNIEPNSIRSSTREMKYGVEYNIRRYLSNVSKERFRDILKEEGFDVNIGNEFTSGTKGSGDYSVYVDVENVGHFFDIIKNLKYLV